MTTAQTAPAVAPKTADLLSVLQSQAMKAQIALALPTHMSADRVLRVMVTQVRKVPKLLDCTQESVLSSLMDCTRMGLEPDGRNAHLIPYENRKKGITECQLIIDYKGLVDLAYRSGLVQSLHADVVCQHDDFEENMGEIVRHKIDRRKPRGTEYAVYARAVLKNGATKCEVMSMEEVDSIRKRSRSGEAGPWKTDFNEMAKKTAFRRLSKWLPLSPEYREAVERDDDTPEEIKDATAGRAPYNAEADARAKAIIDAAPRVDAVDAAEIAAQEAKGE